MAFALKIFGLLRELACCITLALVLASTLGLEARAAESAGTGADPAPSLGQERIRLLQNLSLSDLLVTSVSKKPENQFTTSAAVSVISNEEIRRAGIRRLPEAMALAPGMEVARINGNRWAISARGFNENYAYRLLALMDGRTLYSPAFSGVLWDDQNAVLEDIERIEIIRGPGGTLWGANAVNGVINIITRDAKDTLGSYGTAGYGMEEQGFAAFRHGVKLGQKGFLRAYANYQNYDAMRRAGRDAQDELYNAATGFRSDWHEDTSHLTFQGEYRYGERSEQVRVPTPSFPFSTVLSEEFFSRGAHALFRYTRYLGADSDWQIQAYWDRWERADPTLHYRVDNFDVEFQHRFDWGGRQQIIYGTGYRYQPDRFTENQTYVSLIRPNRRNFQLFSAFVQDEVTLVEDHLKLTLGAKFEHNDYTQFEYQPNVRLTWTPTERQTVWTAVSRTVRIPARAANDMRLRLLSPAPGAIFPRALGQRSFDAEEIISYELGYRIQPVDRLKFDLAAYYSDYNDQLTGQPAPPALGPLPGSLEVTFLATNDGEAETAGFEAAIEWEAHETWRWRGGYTWIDYLAERNLERAPPFTWNRSPAHQFFLRSSMDLGKEVQFDLWGRYKDAIRTLRLGAYFELDARLAWTPTRHLEIALVGKNLLRPQRREFVESSFVAALVSESQRSIFGQVTYRY